MVTIANELLHLTLFKICVVGYGSYEVSAKDHHQCNYYQNTFFFTVSQNSVEGKSITL